MAHIISENEMVLDVWIFNSLGGSFIDLNNTIYMK